VSGSTPWPGAVAWASCTAVRRSRSRAPWRSGSVRDDLAGDAEFRDRFIQECGIAASLDHPHIVPIHAVGDDDGLLHVTMRFVEGTDLREAIRERGRLDPAQAAAVVAQVGAALDAAHRRSLVHRDVGCGGGSVDLHDGRLSLSNTADGTVVQVPRSLTVIPRAVPAARRVPRGPPTGRAGR
jgi:serine/threonine protein kinase